MQGQILTEARSNPIPPGQILERAIVLCLYAHVATRVLKSHSALSALCACCIKERRLHTACANKSTSQAIKTCAMHAVACILQCHWFRMCGTPTPDPSCISCISGCALREPFFNADIGAPTGAHSRASSSRDYCESSTTCRFTPIRLCEDPLRISHLASHISHLAFRISHLALH